MIKGYSAWHRPLLAMFKLDLQRSEPFAHRRPPRLHQTRHQVLPGKTLRQLLSIFLNPDGYIEDEELINSINSSTNVGAIAGGTVGGVAGLAMIGLLVFFLLRRRRRRRTLREESKRAHDNSQSPIVELPVQAEVGRSQRNDLNFNDTMVKKNL